jgi:hypothetical protein
MISVAMGLFRIKVCLQFLTARLEPSLVSQELHVFYGLNQGVEIDF